MRTESGRGVGPGGLTKTMEGDGGGAQVEVVRAGFEFRVPGFGMRVSGCESRDWGFGFQVSDFGSRAP